MEIIKNCTIVISAGDRNIVIIFWFMVYRNLLSEEREMSLWNRRVKLFTSARCFEQIRKVGKVGKVGKEG